MSNSIANCDTCNAPLSLEDITKTQTVRSAYSAVSFECPECGRRFHEVFKAEILAKLVQQVKANSDEADLLVKVFAFDLECVNTVQEFMSYAGMRDVPLERTARVCGCGNCGR